MFFRKCKHVGTVEFFHSLNAGFYMSDNLITMKGKICVLGLKRLHLEQIAFLNFILLLKNNWQYFKY